MPRYSSWPHSSEHPRMERISWMAAVAGTAVSIVAYLVPSPLNLSLVASGPTTANHNTYLGVAVQGMVFFFFSALALGSLIGALIDAGAEHKIGCATASIMSLIAVVGCLACLWLFARIAWKTGLLL